MLNTDTEPSTWAGSSGSTIAQLACVPSDQSARSAHQATADVLLIGFHSVISGSREATATCSASADVHGRNKSPSASTLIGVGTSRAWPMDAPIARGEGTQLRAPCRAR